MHGLSRIEKFRGTGKLSQTSPVMKVGSSKAPREHWNRRQRLLLEKYNGRGLKLFPFLFCILNFSTASLKTEEGFLTNLLELRFQEKKIKLINEK